MKIRMIIKRAFLVVFVLGIGIIFNRISSYLKYNDYEIINNSVIEKQNKIFKEEIVKFSGFKDISDTVIIGKVLYRDLYEFYEEVSINLGDDVVDIGDAVVNDEGLVGVVYKIDNNKSYVKLLSSSYNVSVMVNDTYGNLSNGVITLLDKYSEINVGDLVYTSGLSDTERGILVGKVRKVEIDNEGLGKKAYVELVDNKNLNYIGIIKRIK